MTRNEFIEQFVVTFLATYAATNYADWCARGEHDRFKSLPVEDALDVAGKAYEQFAAEIQHAERCGCCGAPATSKPGSRLPCCDYCSDHCRAPGPIDTNWYHGVIEP